MAQKKKAVREPTRSTPRRRSGRHITENAIPAVYQEMLAEAALSEPLDEGRSVKRRRVEKFPARPAAPQAEVMTPVQDVDTDLHKDPEQLGPHGVVRQTVYDDFAGSQDSGAEFEDVALDGGYESEGDDEQVDEPLQLDLADTARAVKKPTVQRRKGATTAEKKLRLDVHKWHILCLLLHAHCRNCWCDNEEVQAILKPLIPRKLITRLHMDESKEQYARNHAFTKSIEEISEIWQREWSITAKGMRRPFWAEDAVAIADDDDVEDPIDIDDFKEAAQTRTGSRDLGAQLFVALLRSVAVDTRLVCSLQPLPFSGVAKGMTPEKPRVEYIHASTVPHLMAQPSATASPSTATPSNPRWRLSEYASEQAPAQHAPAPPTLIRKRIKESPYPVFWVEVFSPAIDKWIPVDPLVRHTFNKPRTGFEPPASDSLNSMSYVIAFEDDGSARDVTRRYCSHYNAKTRKMRVESTKDGEKWWKRSMRFFKRPFPEPRDQIEDNELATREAQEGMPKSVADFKGHPVYALERHLRRNEVVHPVREVGKVSTGVGSGGKVEPVYRRKDVHVVRSADQWYRRGRDVKMGEQPLKRVVPTKRRNASVPPDEEEEDEGATAGTGMYAEFQTNVYVPPPVVDGRIPRNAYGNLDVYVPSMIPAGAIHVKHPEAVRAARLLGLNYADAVTGFSFKGRHGTAVVNGIVAAADYREALVDVINAIQNERAAAEQEKRSILALQMWKRFMTALRIKERINTEYADAGNDEDMNDETYQVKESDGEFDGGGFMPEAAMEQSDAGLPDSKMPEDIAFLDPINLTITEVVVVESPHTSKAKTEPETKAIEMPRYDSLFDDPDIQDNGGGFIPDGTDGDGGGGFVPEAEEGEEGGGFVPGENPAYGGGGFVPEDEEDPNNDTGGGFLPETTALDESGSIGVTGTAVGNEKEDIVSTADPTLEELPQVDSQGANGSKEGLLRPPPLTKQLSQTSNGASEIRRNSDTSLLSHDPEDDDAEPEWLMDD